MNPLHKSDTTFLSSTGIALNCPWSERGPSRLAAQPAESLRGQITGLARPLCAPVSVPSMVACVPWKGEGSTAFFRFHLGRLDGWMGFETYSVPDTDRIIPALDRNVLPVI